MQTTRLGQRIFECVLLIGTRSAQSIRASGFTAAQTGRTHDRTRPMLQQRQKVLSRIYVSSCDCCTRSSQPVAIGRGPYTSTRDPKRRLSVAGSLAARLFNSGSTDTMRKSPYPLRPYRGLRMMPSKTSTYRPSGPMKTIGQLTVATPAASCFALRAVSRSCTDGQSALS